MKEIKYFVFTVGLSIVWALSLWSNNYREFSRFDSFSFAVYVLVALPAQFLTYTGILYLFKEKRYTPLLAQALNAVFCAFNFYTLVLVHFGRILSLSIMLTWLLLLGLLVTFFVAFKIIHGSEPIRKIIAIFIVLFILQIGWVQYERHIATVEVSRIPDHFEFPRFEKTPNVYLVGFDALLPESVAKKLLGIEKLQYVSVMEEEGLRILKNVFADRVPTRPYFNSLIAMDLDYFDNIPESERYLFATGEVQGPLYKLFSGNGYKIQFIYRSSYFGIQEKSNVDFYGYVEQDGICTHIDYDYALMGYCLPTMARFRKQVTGEEIPAYPDFLFERIKTTAKSAEKWLTIGYIYTPGHTEGDFNAWNPKDLEKYSKEFKYIRDPEAAVAVQELIQTIRTHDPGAILLIFGDHGAWTSRGIPEENVPADSPLTASEVFQDRHAIAFGIYPKDFCIEEFKEPYATARIGRSLAKCLSNGKDVLPAGYQENDDHYLQYVYE